MRRAAFLLLLVFAIACGNREQQSASAKQTAAKSASSNPRVEQGKTAIAQYGCNVCHVIPGIEGGGGQLGPSLAGIASRPTISQGAVQNTPANLAQFVQDPSTLNPQSSMPPIGISDSESEAIAAYLMTLK
jgi:cytochrome c2